MFVAYAQKHHYLRLGMILKHIYKYVVAAAIMFASIMVINHYLTGPLCTVIQIITGIAIYFAMLLILKDKIFYENVKIVLSPKSKEEVTNE